MSCGSALQHSDNARLLADFLDEHAAELVHVVFATAPIYVDARSQRLVKAFLLEAIAASDVFLRTFAAALIKFNPSKRSKQVRALLSRIYVGEALACVEAASLLAAAMPQSIAAYRACR